MSAGTQEVRQVQDRQVAISDDDLAIMDFTEPEKEPESGAEEAGTQTELDKRRWGRCHRRKFMRRQMEMQDGDCQFRSHHPEKKMMKKMAKRWMKKMMWRRMMFRMSYGGPFGMGPGFGCRRRMRMMAATMMDSTDTSSSESGGRQEHGAGWRHRRCCRGRKFGRRFGDGKCLEGQATEKGKDHGAEAQVGNTEETNQNTVPASTSKDGVSTQTTFTENVSNQTESAASGRIHDKKGRRGEHKKWKCMRRVRFCDMSSDDSSSDSSSSDSSSDENEPAQEVTKSKGHGGRHWRRGRRHHHHQQTQPEGNEKIENERGDKCPKGRKAWKGKKFHKKMMKGMGRRGYFSRF